MFAQRDTAVRLRLCFFLTATCNELYGAESGAPKVAERDKNGNEMKHRDRVFTALNHEEPDTCPMHISFTLPSREQHD
jgi:hypothetical protein